MEQELKNVCEFYANANKLKTTIIDEENNLSIADSIYGSAILAIAINSEFNETNNVGKLIMMMVLDEYSKLNDEYNFDKLKLGEDFKELIIDARLCLTKDAILINKYRWLERTLSKLICEYEETADVIELLPDAREILMPIYGDKEKCDEVFRFYFDNFKLIRKVRKGWDEFHWNVHPPRIERVSEHVIGVISTSIVSYSEFEYKNKVDIYNSITNETIHEIGEIIIDDITPFDGITKEQKKELEHEAMRIELGNLSKKNEYYKELLDFDDNIGNDAKFEFVCDKMDADLQSKIYFELGYHNDITEQGNNPAFKSSKIESILATNPQNIFDVWYEFDKGYYKYDTFMEFRYLLDYIKNNNIVYIDNKVYTITGLN